MRRMINVIVETCGKGGESKVAAKKSKPKKKKKPKKKPADWDLPNILVSRGHRNGG